MERVNSSGRGARSQGLAERPAETQDSPASAAGETRSDERQSIPGLQRRTRGDGASRQSPDGNAAAAPRQPAPRSARIAGQALMWGTNLLFGGWAASAAYRLARNPRDFVNAPFHTFNAVVGFNERLGPDDLQAARQQVLDRFGPYIRPQSTCHGVQPQLEFAIGNVAGAYSSNPRGKGPELYVAPFHRAGSGRHAVAHELVHCYTAPAIYDRLIESEAGSQVLDALTEHLADKLPGTRLGKWTAYDRTTMSNGRNMVAAAAELEQAVGEEVLLRAMFGGDAAAVTAVSRAAVELFPKRATLAAWDAIAKAGAKRGAPEMAEAYVAASLMHENALPSDVDSRIWPGAHLPQRRFSDITRPQKSALLAQARAMRERVGAAAFDQAFCNFDDRAALVAMRAVRADLVANWKRVL
jgi:hypothetical protein